MNFALSVTEPKIEQQQLLALLQNAHATPEIICCKSNTHSTNDDCQLLYQQGFQSAIVISHQQSHGRGQRQRNWISTTGNIFFSALIKLDRPIDGRFALECALNLIHMPTLQHLDHLQIKWANDLYSTHGKWGGILVEPVTTTHVIVGVGINIVPVLQQENIQQAVTSLTELGLKQYDRVAFLSEIYLALIQASQWFNYNSLNLAQRFNHVAAFKDQWITIQREQQADITGSFCGIQNDGAILVQQAPELEPTVCYDGRLIIPN